MPKKKFSFRIFICETISDSEAALIGFKKHSIHAIVPAEVTTPKGKKLQLNKIKYNYSDYHVFGMEIKCVDHILFDESSKIKSIPLSFILYANKRFDIPKQIKQVESNCSIALNNIIITPDEDNEFISVSGRSTIIQNHRFQFISCNFKRNRLVIRETMKTICNTPFYKSLLRYVLKCRILKKHKFEIDSL